MKQRLAPFLVLLEARYAPLLFAVAPQSYAVFLWLWQGSDKQDASFWFAVMGALGYELVYVGAIAWAEEGRSSFWTWATAGVALIFSVVVAYYVYRAQGAWAWLHAGFPLVAFTYTLNMHTHRPVRRGAETSQEAPGAAEMSEPTQITQGQPALLKTALAKDRHGFVYIALANGAYKIGRSLDVQNRLNEIAVFLPFPLELAHEFETDDMYRLESALHKVYKDKHINGEWFQLNDGDVEMLVSFGNTLMGDAIEAAIDAIALPRLQESDPPSLPMLEAPRYRCPHCASELTSKQAMGSAARFGCRNVACPGRMQRKRAA